MKFSNKERALLLRIGYEKEIKLVEDGLWSINSLYDHIGEYCFLNNIQGKDAQSVKNILLAQRDYSVYRGTHEFDNLILDN